MSTSCQQGHVTGPKLVARVVSLATTDDSRVCTNIAVGSVCISGFVLLALDEKGERDLPRAWVLLVRNPLERDNRGIFTE